MGWLPTHIVVPKDLNDLDRVTVGDSQSNDDRLLRTVPAVSLSASHVVEPCSFRPGMHRGTHLTASGHGYQGILPRRRIGVKLKAIDRPWPALPSSVASYPARTRISVRSSAPFTPTSTSTSTLVLVTHA